MPILPVADYAPDRAPLGGAHLPVAQGVFPRSDGNDGPLRAPAILSDALPGQVRGAAAARTAARVGVVVGGTPAGLFLLDGMTWQDKSKTGGYALGTERWRFCQFGDRLIAASMGAPTQSYTLGGAGAFADLAATAPRGRFIATIEPGFVMLGDYLGGALSARNGVWWSGLNDATVWPTPGTAAAQSVQSDLQQLPNGGYVTGLAGAVGGAAGVVFTERALYRIEYIGPPQIFAFREVDRSRGNAAPDGIARVGSTVFFVSEDGFVAFDGTEARNIGFGRVDRSFLAALAPDGLDRITATVDLARKLVVWSYPTSGGVNDRWLIYSYGADRWRACDDPAIMARLLFPASMASVSIDALDAMFPGGIDAVPVSLDSAALSGGRPILAGFDASSRLVAYEGSTLAARVETADLEPGPNRLMVSGLRPMSDAPGILASVGGREALTAALTYTPGTLPALDAFAPQRVTARYLRGRLDVPAGVEWTYLQGADLRAQPVGRR